MIDLEQFRILIRTEIQNAKELDSLKGKLQETKKETSYTASAFKDMGGSLAASLGGAALAMAAFSAASQFVGDSIKEASDAAEQASKFNVVFGDSAGQASQKISEFADSAGRSKYELSAMAASVQDTFVPLGFAREKAAGLSVELVKLATDVASFNNASDAEVMSNFQSALVGQGEAVRKYGIIINETTLNQELLNMGITGGAKAASEQEKVQARLSIIYKGTSDAQGDAARTAGSLANMQKAAAASTKDLQVAVGNLLTPAMKDLVKIQDESSKSLADYVEQLDNFVNVNAKAEDKIGTLISSFKTGKITFEQYRDGLDQATKGTSYMIDAQGNLVKRTEGMGEVYTVVQRHVLEYQSSLYSLATAEEATVKPAEDAKLAQEALKQAIKETKDGFGYLNEMIAGEVTKSFDDYLAKQNETKDKIKEINDQIKELNKTPWSDPSGEKHYDLAKSYTEEKLKLGELTKEYEKNTQAMLLNMAQKYLSAQVESGTLSSLDAMKAANKMAEMWGMIDKPTALLNDAMADLVSQYATGSLTLEQFSAKAQALNDAAVGAASSSKTSAEYADNFGAAVSKIPGLVTTQIKVEAPSAEFVKGMLDGLPSEKTIKVNVEMPDNSLAAFRSMDEKFGAKDAKITITADAAGAKTEIKSVQDILDGYPTTKSTDIATTGTSRVTTELGIVSQSLDNLPTSKTIQVSTSGAGEVQNDFWMIQQSIDALQDRDYWVTVHVKKVQDDSSDEAAADTINPGNGMARRGNSSGASQTVNYTYYAPVTYTSDTTMVTDLQARRF